MQNWQFGIWYVLTFQDALRKSLCILKIIFPFLFSERSQNKLAFDPDFGIQALQASVVFLYEKNFSFHININIIIFIPILG